MRRLIISSFLALVALAALATTAPAATPTPVITSFSPAQVRVGQTLIINGKNFRKGVRNNRVFFSRASDGKTVRTRPSKANSTRRMEVVVPPGVTKYLTILNGQASATRFQLQILSGKFSKKTARSRSPIVLPANATDNGGGGPVGVTPPPPADCDNDGTPDSTDTDDDNDGLSDEIEANVHTDPCKKDTDGDGIEDGYEYYSALDLNSNNTPYPGKRPYPNPLDSTDALKDFDGDGLSMTLEFQAWSLFGGRVLPSAAGQSFPYSDGNQSSTAPANAGGANYDQSPARPPVNPTGITDDEKDADNDGVANWVELAVGQAAGGLWTLPNGTTCPVVANTNGRYQDCGAGSVPNGVTFAAESAPPFFANTSWYKQNWLDPDSDGDGLNDLIDDLDHDDVSNQNEMLSSKNPVDPCDPDTESRACAQHVSG